LQYGVPLKSYVRVLMSRSFPPAGITDDSDIRTASSMTDYIVRRLALDYLSFDDRLELGLASLEDMPMDQTTLLTDDQSVGGHLREESAHPTFHTSESVPAVLPSSVVRSSTADHAAPLCYNCGNQTQRAGSCYVCTSCGSTTGCS
jgi:ribonucleoside-diphosphate reductase alpha chain